MIRLRLAWRLARRELRGGLKGFRVFLVSLTLGVAAIAAVAATSAAVTDALRSDARLLLGGDLEARLTQRMPSDAEAAWLRDNAAAVSEIVEMRAMARPAPADADPDVGGDPGAEGNPDVGGDPGAGAASMVELKAVDAGYPLLGEVEVPADEPLAALLARRDGAWGAVAEPALLERLGVDVGDTLRVGSARLELRGTVEREPDRIASVAAFGPRLMVSAGALRATGLVQPGSLFRHATRILLPAGTTAEEWTQAVRTAFPEAGWRIRSTAEAAPGVERLVERLAMFLSFAGLTALLIGGLGVANAVKAYLDGKAGTIAILKCVGAPGALVMASYLIQVLVLAGLGTALGLVVGSAAPLLAAGALQPMLPAPLAFGVYPGAVATAAGLGLLTALTFSLWPLARAREVPAANLFRQGVAGISGRPRAIWIAATGIAAVALAALVVFTTPDRLFGAIFVAGAILTLASLRAGASLVRWLARRAPRAGHAALRLAVDGLHRPGASTALVLTSLGAGLTVLVAVALIEANLRAQIAERLPDRVPAFFFIDIQSDQVAAFEETLASVDGVGGIDRMPALRGRIMAIDGVDAERATVAPEAAWALRGDRGVTFAAAQPQDADVVAGSWWPADYDGPPLISLDAGIAEGFGVGIGDTLTINVLGRNIEAEIASLRRIEWQAVPLAFTIVATPGTVAGAPHTHIAAVYAEPSAEAPLARAVGARLPNVTQIRTRDTIEAVSGLIERLGWGVRAAAAVTLLAGVVVLAGAIAADRRRRDYEAVLFKMLGATRRRIAQIYALEYAVLGLVTALIAAALGTAVGWGVTTLLMDFEWRADAGVIATTVFLGVVLALGVGLAGTWRRLGQRTAPYLRNE
jgi:putative ABC transport system permease protein